MAIRFLDFELDDQLLELRGPAGAIAMEPQVFKLLRFLIDHRDRVVSKDELVSEIWDGRFVTDAAITSRINLLRKAVGDSGKVQSVIRTVPKTGYRFVADVDLPEKRRPDTGLPAVSAFEQPDLTAPSVVVLPFRDLSPPEENDFLAEGLTEDISVALSRSSDITVIANRSARAVEDVAPLISDVGRKLQVKYAVRGAVQRAGNRVRVSASLIDTEIGKHIWADRFDGAKDEIFDIQDRVTQSIAAVLPTRIQGTVLEQEHIRAEVSLSSREAYLRAIWNLRQSGDVVRAIDDLGSLLVQDERYALAHAQLAVLLGFSIFVFGRDEETTRVRAIAHARQALALESSDERVLAKAALAFLNDGDFKRALHYSEKALTLNPHSVEAIHFRGCVLYGTGAHEGALDCHRTAMRLDPLFPGHYLESVIETNFLLGRYEEALSIHDSWDRPHPHMSVTMAACNAMAGRMEEAHRFAEDFRKSRPEGFRLADYFSALMRYLAREEDQAHWREGFMRSGLWPEAGKSGNS